jgi:hypothetical protein
MPQPPRLEKFRRNWQSREVREPAPCRPHAEERNGMFSPALRRDVIVMLCLKAAALTLLYFLFFSDKPTVTPAAVQQQLSR